MKTNYCELISKQNMTWDWSPKNIFEGPFTGNGETGISLYFKDDGLYMNLGNTDIYDNRLPTEEMSYKDRENLFLTPRLSLGGFTFKIEDGFKSTEMLMDVYNGILSGKLTDGNKSVSYEAYTAENENAVVFQWRENGIRLIPVFSPSYAASPRQKMMTAIGHEKRVSHHYDVPKEPYTKEENGASAHIQPKYNGGNYSITYKQFIKGNEHTLIVIISQDRDPDFGRADEIYNSLSEIRTFHDNFWNNFYKSSSLELDDKKYEQFYWLQLYKCACATRENKRVFDTSGPWLDNFTAWPAGWWNLNVELHYSLLYPSNHLEIAASLPNAIEAHKDELRNNVPEKYRNGRYITVGRNTTSTLSTPCGIPGVDDKEIELELGNLIWALHNCYIHFSSAADDEALSGVFFDNLKNAAEYILIYLEKKKDGKYHLPPTTSPEYPGLSEDCNYTFALLKWALITLLKLKEKYGIEDKDAPVWQEYLDNYADFPYDDNQGFMIGRDKPLAMSHRHYSHLLMIYPLHLLNEYDETDREKIVRSIEHWHSMPEAMEGYSQTGAASMYAVLGDGNKALSHLETLFKGFICPNTMYNEDMNPVLETPPAAARSVLDMVMYSHNDEIRVFDAVPDKWQNVKYENLLSESGCLVSAIRENGETVFVKIQAKKKCSVRLKAAFTKEVSCDKAFTKEGNFYFINLDKDEEIILNQR